MDRRACPAPYAHYLVDSEGGVFRASGKRGRLQRVGPGVDGRYELRGEGGTSCLVVAPSELMAMVWQEQPVPKAAKPKGKGKRKARKTEERRERRERQDAPQAEESPAPDTET